MKSKLVLLSLLFSFVAPITGQAMTIDNRSFETGDFTGWLTIGEASVRTNAFGSGPTDGNFQALIATDSNGDRFPGDNNAVPTANLAGFFGVTNAQLDLLDDNLINGSATEGSGILQSFNSTAGSLSFDWNFLTSENNATFPAPDSAFLYLDGTVTLLDSFLTATLGASPTFYDQETGFFNSILALAAGPHTIGFGVFDSIDENWDTGLLVDNLKFQATVIPEVSTVALMLLSLPLGLAFHFKRK